MRALLSPFLPRLLLAALAIPLLPGCGVVKGFSAKTAEKKKQKALDSLSDSSQKEAQGRLGTRASGEVVWVDNESKFVLIRVLEGATVVSGTKLDARRGSSKSGELLTTPENKRPFIAADIVSGEPAVGDSIIATGTVTADKSKLVLVGETPDKESGSEMDDIYRFLQPGAAPPSQTGEALAPGVLPSMTAPALADDSPAFPEIDEPALPPMDSPAPATIGPAPGPGPRILTVEDVLGSDPPPPASPPGLSVPDSR